MRGVALGASMSTLILALAGCADDPAPAAAPPTTPALPPLDPHVLIVPGVTNLSLIPNATKFALHGLGMPAYEPTLGVTSSGAVFVVAGTKVARSTDSGFTWNDAGPKVGPMDVPPTTLDPFLHVDPATDRVFVDQLYVGCSALSWSDDEGASWISNPAACGLPGNDHQSLAAGLSDVAAPLYQDRAVYYCANQVADSTCSVSLDGGLTFPIKSSVFAAADPPPCVGELMPGGGIGWGVHGHVVVGPDATAYLPAWRCDEPWVALSKDTALSWVVQRVSDKSAGAMDPSLAVDRDNTLYYFWMDTEGQPWLAASTDMGATWREPIDVRFPGYVTGTLPTVVAGDRGRVALAYVATTEGEVANPGDVGDGVAWNLYVTMSTNVLSTLPNFTTVQLNPANDPVHRGACEGGYRCGAIFDFMDIAMGPDGRVYVASVDSCAGNCTGTTPVENGTGYGEGLVGVLLEGPSLLGTVKWLAMPVAPHA